MPCSQQYGAIPRAVFEAHQALAERSHFNYDKWNGEMIGGGFLGLSSFFLCRGYFGCFFLLLLRRRLPL